MPLTHGKTPIRRGEFFIYLFIYSILFLVKLSETDGFDDPLDRTPRRRDPPTWLKENPDYEVEGDMLEVHLQTVLFTFSLASKVTLPASTIHTLKFCFFVFFFSFSLTEPRGRGGGEQINL